MDPQDDALPSIDEVVAERFPWFSKYQNKAHHHAWLEHILADFRRQLLEVEGDVLGFLKKFFEVRGRSAYFAQFEPESYNDNSRGLFVRAWTIPSEDTWDLLYDYDDVPQSASSLIERLTILWGSFPTKRDVWSYIVATIVAGHLGRVSDCLVDKAIMRDPCLRQAFPRYLGGLSNTFPASRDYMMLGDIHLNNYIAVSKIRLNQIAKNLGGTTTPDFRDVALDIAHSVADFYFYKGYTQLQAEEGIAVGQLATPEFVGKLVEKSGLEAVIEHYMPEGYWQMYDQLPRVVKYDQPLWRIQEIVLYRLLVSVQPRNYASLYRYVEGRHDELINIPVKLNNDPWRLLEELDLDVLWEEDPQEAIRRIFWDHE